MVEYNVLPGDTSKEAKDAREKLRRAILNALIDAEIEVEKRKQELQNLPCMLCGRGSCPRDCW